MPSVILIGHGIYAEMLETCKGVFEPLSYLRTKAVVPLRAEPDLLNYENVATYHLRVLPETRRHTPVPWLDAR